MVVPLIKKGGPDGVSKGGITLPSLPGNVCSGGVESPSVDGTSDTRGTMWFSSWLRNAGPALEVAAEFVQPVYIFVLDPVL